MTTYMARGWTAWVQSRVSMGFCGAGAQWRGTFVEIFAMALRDDPHVWWLRCGDGKLQAAHLHQRLRRIAVILELTLHLEHGWQVKSVSRHLSSPS